LIKTTLTLNKKLGKKIFFLRKDEELEQWAADLAKRENFLERKVLEVKKASTDIKVSYLFNCKSYLTTTTTTTTTT